MLSSLWMWSNHYLRSVAASNRAPSSLALISALAAIDATGCCHLERRRSIRCATTRADSLVRAANLAARTRTAAGGELLRCSALESVLTWRSLAADSRRGRTTQKGRSYCRMVASEKGLWSKAGMKHTQFSHLRQNQPAWRCSSCTQHGNMSGVAG